MAPAPLLRVPSHWSCPLDRLLGILRQVAFWCLNTCADAEEYDRQSTSYEQERRSAVGRTISEAALITKAAKAQFQETGHEGRKYSPNGGGARTPRVRCDSRPHPSMKVVRTQRSAPEVWRTFAERRDAMEQEAVVGQEEMHFGETRRVTVGAPAVLDLFAGMGGFSSGFHRAGFTITAVDRLRWSPRVFERHGVSSTVTADLHTECITIPADVVIGGPPCRPWSKINRQLNSSRHPDQSLLERFIDHIIGIRPEAFLFENVPPVWADPIYQAGLEQLVRAGYTTRAMVIDYSDFGAATARQRLFTVGFRGSPAGASTFFDLLRAYRRPAQTVGDAIGWLRDVERGGEPDHEWPELTTIARYRERYESGKYGWRHLDYGSPAPSFGNATKTYTLHPDSAPGEPGARIVSVRELSCIMGFSRDFTFPEGIPLSARYQMLADTISPIFSHACARVLQEMLSGRVPSAGSAVDGGTG